MVLVKARIRQWGSSLGIVIPKAKALHENLKKDQEVIVEIKAQDETGDLFGSLKGWKIDSQKVKNNLRKEWSKW